MSAVDSNFITAGQAPEWLPLAMAGKKWGVHPDTLGKKCRAGLTAAGLAKYDRDPATGQDKLFIHRSLLPAFQAAESSAPQSESDLSRYTARQRELALLRKLHVDRLRKLRRESSASIRMTELVDRIVDQARAEFPTLKISRGSLYRWDRLYSSPGNLHRLVDDRGGDQRGASSDEAWDAFRNIFLHQNQPTVRFCWKTVKRLAADAGWTWISYSACRRQLNDRIPPSTRTFIREPRKFRNQLEPSIAQDSESWAAGELWTSDHKQLDLICLSRGSLVRPWITAWMDWRTRKICGWVLSETPNSTTILAALKQGLTDPSNMGGPSKIRVDNGRDYDSRLLHGQTKRERRMKIRPDAGCEQKAGTFNLLGIEAYFAMPFNPRGKARQERGFGKFTSFARTFETYTGIDTNSKPERLAEILGKSPHLVPTFEAVRDRLADFIAGYNASADHQIDDLIDGGQRLSPADAFARWCDTKRIMADPASLDLILQHWHKPVTCGKNGIALTIGGRVVHYGQFEADLNRFKALSKRDRRPLNVSYDPDDASSVRVYDEKFRFVCVAPMNAVGGRGDAVPATCIADSQRQRSKYLRAVRDVAAGQLTEILTPEEHIRDIAAKRRHADRQAEAEPASRMRIHRSPLDGQAKRAQPQELRRAVGDGINHDDDRGPSMLDALRSNLTPRRRGEEIGSRGILESLEALTHGD